MSKGTIASSPSGNISDLLFRLACWLVGSIQGGHLETLWVFFPRAPLKQNLLDKPGYASHFYPNLALPHLLLPLLNFLSMDPAQGPPFNSIWNMSDICRKPNANCNMFLAAAEILSLLGGLPLWSFLSSTARCCHACDFALELFNAQRIAEKLWSLGFVKANN